MRDKIFSIPVGQFFVGLFWLVLAGVALAGTLSLRTDPGLAVGPALFPRLLAVGLIVLGGLYWRQARKGLAATDGEDEAIRPGGRRRMVGLVALALTAAALWEPLGALPTLFCFCLAELKWLEASGWGKALLAGAIATTLVWLSFNLLLGVNLPLGVLILLY